jgi:hypothetical protein
MLIQSLLATDDDVRRASEHQVRLEAIAVRSGGIAGPGSLGSLDDL